MSGEIWTDKRFLREEQYRDEANLRARIELHARFSTNPGWHEWLYDRLAIEPGERVLEVGCGAGDLWRANLERLPAFELTLVDLSPGMLEAARAAVGARAQLLVADAQALPFSDATFDLVVANHMLYHLPDLEEGLAEIARVLRPGGRVVAATNGEAHLRELDEVAGPDGRPSMRGFVRFGLENGPGKLAAAGFVDVAVVPYEDALEVTEVEPALAYLRSMLLVPSDRALARIEQEVRAAIERDGTFHVTKEQGLVVGRRP